jgi:peptide/nickel transport system substrate-binding protein
MSELNSSQTSTRRLRWQVIVLILALVVIAGSVIFMLARPDGIPPSPGAAPRSVALITTQVYTEAEVGEPVWVNPLLAVSHADRDLASLIFSGLTRLDEFGQPTGDLAVSWEVSSDGLTYTFHLRPSVTWQDGAPFTANDVAYTMSLLRDPAFPGAADLAAFWRTIETYALDDTTVEFVLTQPLASFPEYAGIGILPAHILAETDAASLPDDPFNLQPVGTGRMQWESMESEGETTVVTLRPYTGFYDAPRIVKLDGLVFRFYADANRAFAALNSDAQGYGGLDESQISALLESSGLALYSSRLPNYGAILFNEQNAARLPFFQDVQVRRALWMALDREKILHDVLGLQAIVADSTILPGSWAGNQSLTTIPVDPAQAAALLDAAGWTLDGTTRAKDGVRFSFTLLVNQNRVDQALGEAIRDQWRALGIDVTVQAMDAEALLAQIQKPPAEDTGRDFDAILIEFSQGAMADPDPYAFWHDSQIAEGQNYSGFSERDMDEELEIARRDPNGVRRAELYRSFQQNFLNQAPAILLYNPLYHYAVSCQVQGVQIGILADPAQRFDSVHEWRILPADSVSEVCPSS